MAIKEELLDRTFIALAQKLRKLGYTYRSSFVRLQELLDADTQFRETFYAYADESNADYAIKLGDLYDFLT